MNAKLAELLLRLGDEYGIEDSRGMLVALKITHQEMANLIGSTRETVSLTLSQFKRRGSSTPTVARSSSPTATGCARLPSTGPAGPGGWARVAIA